MITFKLLRSKFCFRNKRKKNRNDIPKPLKLVLIWGLTRVYTKYRNTIWRILKFNQFSFAMCQCASIVSKFVEIVYVNNGRIKSLSIVARTIIASVIGTVSRHDIREWATRHRKWGLRAYNRSVMELEIKSKLKSHNHIYRRLYFRRYYVSILRYSDESRDFVSNLVSF